MNNFHLAHLTHLILGESFYFLTHLLLRSIWLTFIPFSSIALCREFHVCAWVFVIFLAILQPPSLYPPWFFSVSYLLLILTNILVILIHNYSTDHHRHEITLKSIPVSLTSLLNSCFTICSSLQGFPGGTSGKKKKKKIHLLMQEMQETWVPSLGREDPLEEEMATYSSSFAWRIP